MKRGQSDISDTINQPSQYEITSSLPHRETEERERLRETEAVGNTKLITTIQTLETSGNGEKLQELLYRLPKTDDLQNNEAILKAKATAAFFRGDFRDLYKVRKLWDLQW